MSDDLNERLAAMSKAIGSARGLDLKVWHVLEIEFATPEDTLAAHEALAKASYIGFEPPLTIGKRADDGGAKQSPAQSSPQPIMNKKLPQ